MKINFKWLVIIVLIAVAFAVVWALFTDLPVWANLLIGFVLGGVLSRLTHKKILRRNR